PSLLERALDGLLRRHAALRTVFPVVGGEPMQYVVPGSHYTLPAEPFAVDDGAALQARLAAETARPFDLAAGPLFRALLLRGEGEDVLLLVIHHLVFDGWSTGVLLRELGALYDAFARGEPATLPSLPARYADYALWQRERLARVEDAQLAWWRARLAGAPALLELPTDRPRPAAQSHRGAQHRLRLPRELMERARALGRDEGATLHMVVLAALSVVLARHAGAEELVVGSIHAGRTHPDAEPLVGFFANTLPIRAELAGDPDFRGSVRQVRDRTLEAYDRQDVPFDRLVEAVCPVRSPSHAPLVQVAFAFQDAPAAGLRLGDAEVRYEWVDPGTAQFDLSLLLDEDEAGAAGVVEYATDLFDAATVARLAGHLEQVLAQAVAAPDGALSRLSLLTDAERRLLEDWNRTEAPFPAELCIHQLFEAQAARTPHAVALVCEERTVTYGALNARANRLAHRLMALGVGPEDRVGVCMRRGPEMVAALLAVLKAGGAYVPLDPAYPAERLAFTLRDASVAALLTEPELRCLAPVADGVAVLDATDDGGLGDEPAHDPAPRATPRNLAYLIYTSGSTGVPKGVAIEHRSAVAMLAWGADVYPADVLDGMLASTSICFDISVFELFLPLSVGGRVIIVENALALPKSAVAAQVRLVNTVPSAIAALLKAGGIPAGVRTVNLAGEPLRPELADAVYARPGIEKVYDLYGPSEDTTYSTFALRAPGGPETIGRTIANSRAYVLGPGMQPLPVGVAGELYLGGMGLARGYLGRPSLTAERFVPDPFSAEPGARLYRTGDRIRWKSDGTLEYWGRLDNQVKVRGYRIELGEVESALRRHPGVRECVVVVREDAPGDRRLVAYLAGDADADALRAHLKTTLPEYMVPGAFVVMDHLPLNPNGKIDRKALPAPGPAASPSPAAPRTPVEEVLAAIWGEVLGREQVGAGDDFFALGGHSLLATRVVSRIAEVFGVELTMRALFEAPTLAALAARVEAARRADTMPSAPLVAVDRAGPLAASFAQERLWFLNRLRPDSAFYVIPIALRFTGALDPRALERALGEVVRRHEALRTTFAEREGAPVQVIAPFAGFALPSIDVTSVDGDAREAAIERAMAEGAARPFDLERGPLYRASLLRFAEDDHLLLLSVHHAVCDEWSTGVLFAELSALYRAFRDGT
ncbi:MAG TPA: amino acid adenylation domain-containing protein, partial [Longimicrobiaceae bacterium]|nr:amino acid adenylation domain-containing protein [Longimicrobiaceae bacterium]